MMSSLKTECRKFAPNIFNKSKCQNCFRGKDAHSSEALESNRATRKASFCGYLFVAPDWDFSLPANRNKRWQRRWFVLYDDGELAYSVDEHPETVPQAVIDMNCVLEVLDAENVTGNPFALSVTCPEKVHFIKGTSKDETKKWFEVLSKFPQNTICGKYKRNATFPCIKSANISKLETSISNRRDGNEISPYSKHNGYVNTLTRANLKPNTNIVFDPEEDVYPTKDTNPSPVIKHPEKCLMVEVEKKKENICSTPNEAHILRNVQERNIPKPEDSKKYLKQELREVRKHHSRSDVTRMIPSLSDDKLNIRSDWKKLSLDLSPDCLGKNFHSPVYLLMPESGQKVESYENFYLKDKQRCLRRQSSFGKKSEMHKQVFEWTEKHREELHERTIHKSASVPNACLRDDNKILMNGMSSKSTEHSVDTVDRSHLKLTINQVRGDPDGCNLDSMPSSCCTSTTELHTQHNSEFVFLKKGWLVKQDDCKWNKYWFVLRNSALTYYSDPIAEDACVIDGYIDLRKVKSVSEVESSSGYTFCVLMKDCSKLYLSAVTGKIRNNWLRAILQSANLKSIDDIAALKKTNSEMQSPNIVFTDSTIGLDSEKSTSSSSSKTLEDTPKQNAVALPPSPPVARTAISRVKERAKTRIHRTRGSRFNSAEIYESTHSCNVDSDDGTTDHSSSSLLNATIAAGEEKKIVMESTPTFSEIRNKPERRRSFKLSSMDSMSFQEGRKKVTDIKDKLEDSSWTIWLDISKFCKEVESKLDDLEVRSPKNGPHLTGDQKKELGGLVCGLNRVEDRLHRVQSELEKTKVNLLLHGKDGDLNLAASTPIGCHSLKQEVSRLSGISSQNVLLAQQLNNVREENRRMKADLKQTHSSSDDLELKCLQMKQAKEQSEMIHRSQMELMIARVEDLTNKLLNSEKNVRQLRQRVTKLEQRQERRRSSLKGKEGLTLSKEYEAKLTELEQKIGHVEDAIRSSDGSPTNETSKEEVGKESQSLLIRLSNLDRKVKDVAETVLSPSEEIMAIPQEELPKPKIRLQVKENENAPSPDEGWNSLSLSTSMTDLTIMDKDMANEDDPLSISFSDCLETLSHKMSSLVSWLKTSLQLLYAQGHMNPFQSSKLNLISGEAGEELSKLVRTLDHVTSRMDEPSISSQSISSIVSRLLYNILLLQEVSNIMFKMSDFEKYKTSILVQHLKRVQQTLLNVEQYIQQKSVPVNSSVQKISLCNIAACLLFYRCSSSEASEVSSVENLFDDVDTQRKKVCAILNEFKEKFIERFCATILELSEDSACDRQSATDPKSGSKPLGQKQFLSHISHIISQVSQSFINHVSKCHNDVYFLCSSFQYSEKWTEYICKLLQQELSLLSSEIKSICVKHLENGFFSSSKCGVLVEYMHCSISELAQIVAIGTVIDGTVILIKDAIHSSSCTGEKSSSTVQGAMLPVMDKESLNAFHENLQLRTMGIMSNLPLYRFPESFFNFCSPNELSVAHRSVSSLLCFKHKWKSVIESERKEHQTQLETLSEKITELQTEQSRCRTCIELRCEISHLQAEVEECRTIARTGSLCDKCQSLRIEIQSLKDQRDNDLKVLKKLECQDVAWKERLEGILQDKEHQFNLEKHHLETELQKSQRNLKEMESHYEKELKSLQQIYDQKLQMKSGHLREDIKAKYYEEIMQLKSLCEKTLTSVDMSHKKIVSELEQRHQSELESIKQDRERSLAEEAQATTLALEAVRKAHSEELQRQIQKFKDDFVMKMNKRFETEAFRKCYESDWSTVKSEILSLTENYSVKCLENATLHEKLEVMNQQLKSTTTQVIDLLAKNQQLQARLSSGLQKQEEAGVIEV